MYGPFVSLEPMAANGYCVVFRHVLLVNRKNKGVSCQNSVEILYVGADE